MTDEPERQVYHLTDEHSEWSDLDDIHPKTPRIPSELEPPYTEGEQVYEVDDLQIYGFHETPHFPEIGAAAVEATPEELARWKAAGDRYLEAAQEYRREMTAAAARYETAHEDALRKLRAAKATYQPVEDVLRDRAAELAVKLHGHREAARLWQEKQYEKEQANLDAIHGPRILALYPPKDLDAPRQGDHLAKVHLTSCKRKGRTTVSPVRAPEAWKYLKDPASWPNGAHNSHAGRHRMRVMLCSFCEPWIMLMEHAHVTAKEIGTTLNLTEWPERMRDVSRGTSDAVDE